MNNTLIKEPIGRILTKIAKDYREQLRLLRAAINEDDGEYHILPWYATVDVSTEVIYRTGRN